MYRTKGERIFPIFNRKTPILDIIRGSGEEGGVMERVRRKLKAAKGEKEPEGTE